MAPRTTTHCLNKQHIAWHSQQLHLLQAEAAAAKEAAEQVAAAEAAAAKESQEAEQAAADADKEKKEAEEAKKKAEQVLLRGRPIRRSKSPDHTLC